MRQGAAHMYGRPLVSVVMPCFNCRAFVKEAVDSVLAQTLSDFELIVVDDGSTDGSANVLARLERPVRVITQSNQGLPAARNAGIEASKGRYIAFLDSDDYWAPHFLERMTDVLERSDAELAYCGWQNIGVTGGRGEPFVPPDYEARPDKDELLFQNSRWPVHAALLRVDSVRRVGGFDRRWKSCEDFALWLELAVGRPIISVPEVLAYYRHHGQGQMTANTYVVADNLWRIQKDFLRRNPAFRFRLGRRKIRHLIYGEQLRRAYVCYWARDLDCARKLFRRVMRGGFGRAADWPYLTLSLLPRALQAWLLRRRDSRGPGKRREQNI